MFREYFIVLLFGHILGGFYLQTKGMAAKKEKSIKWVLIHGLCYCDAISWFANDLENKLASASEKLVVTLGEVRYQYNILLVTNLLSEGIYYGQKERNFIKR